MVLEPPLAGGWWVCSVHWLQEGDGTCSRTAHSRDWGSAVKNITSFWLGGPHTDEHALRWVFLACPWPYRSSYDATVVLMEIRPFVGSLEATE